MWKFMINLNGEKIWNRCGKRVFLWARSVKPGPQHCVAIVFDPGMDGWMDAATAAAGVHGHDRKTK